MNQIKSMNFTKFCEQQEIALIPIVTEQFHDAPRTSIVLGRLGSIIREVDNQLIRMTEDDRILRTGRAHFRIPENYKPPVKVR